MHPISRNVKSHVNPFEVVREYQRALNATKLERVFAKPFVGSLDGHTDGVSIITKNPLKLNRLVILGLNYFAECPEIQSRTVHPSLVHLV